MRTPFPGEPEIPPGIVTINQFGQRSDDHRSWWAKMWKPFPGGPQLPHGTVTINQFGQRSDDHRSWWAKMWTPFVPPEERERLSEAGDELGSGDVERRGEADDRR